MKALRGTGALIVARVEDMPREEWLALRREGLGGSDAAAVAGLCPWRSPLAVWMEKSGLEPGEKTGENLLWGNLLEPVVRGEFQRRTGFKVQKCPYLLASPERPWMRANLDGLVREPGGLGVLEIKTTSSWMERHWEDGHVPDHYRLQVAHYLGVTGLSFCWVAALIGGQRLVLTRIDRDEALLHSLLEIERAFWEGHVLGKVPPDPGGTDADAEALKSLFPGGNEEEAVLSPETQTLVGQWERAREEERAAEERRKEAENRLKALMGDHERARVGERTIRWSTVESRRLDTKALQAAHPDICGQFTKTSVARRFEIR